MNDIVQTLYELGYAYVADMAAWLEGQGYFKWSDLPADICLKADLLDAAQDYALDKDD